MRAFRDVATHLVGAIRAYRNVPLFRDCLIATIGSPFPCSYMAASRRENIFASAFFSHCVQTFATDGTVTRTWGTSGSGVGQFRYPSGIAVAETGEVVVTDTDNHRVQVFRTDGTFVRWFGSEGHNPGQLHCPRGVGVTKDGEVVVADRLNHRIQVFRLSDGAWLRQWGVQGSEPGQFDHPVAVCVTPDGRVVVADEGNDRIQVFGPSGIFLHQWRVQCPRIVTVRGHDVWVVGRINLIQVFRFDGTFAATWRPDLDDDAFCLIGLAVTPSGRVLVGEQDQIHMYA